MRVASPRFVGRDAELGRVVEALSRLPALVLVEGEAGMGKSRLVREALAAAGDGGPRVLVAGCPPLREALTLGPVVDAARQACRSVADLGLSPLAGALRPLFPEWAPELPPAPDPPADAGAARHRLIRALAELLDLLGTEVLVVEDVHWADEATLEFLVFLASRAPRPLSLVLTYRPDETAADSLLLRLSSRPTAGVAHVRIALGGLAVEDSADLVSSMLDDEHVSGAFATLLQTRTEGVPLALEECVRLLHDRADLVRRNGEWVRRSLDEIAVPPTIRDAVTERAAHLGPDAQRVLFAAAVLSDPSGPAALAAVAGLARRRAEAGVAEAIGSGLLAEDPAGRVAFRHALAARAVYDRATAAERSTAHRAAAEHMERHGPREVARLAHHFHAAGETASRRTYAEEAADLALTSGDHLTAVTLLHQLVTAPELPPSAVAPLVRKMPLHAFTGYPRRAEVLAALRAVLDGGGLGTRDRAEARSQLGRILIHLAEYGSVAAELEQAIPYLEEDLPGLAAWAMIALGVPRVGPWPAATHRRWLARAERLVAAATGLPEHERLGLRVDMMTALLDLGDEAGWTAARQLSGGGPGLSGAQADRRAAQQTAQQTARGSLNLGNGALRWGKYGQAREALAAAVDVAGRYGYQRLRDMALVTLVHLDFFIGAWDGLLQRAEAWRAAEDEPLFWLDALLVTTGLRIAATGPTPADEESLRVVRAESERRGAMDMMLEAAAGQARIALAAGDAEAAIALTEEPVRLIARKEVWVWATEVVPVRADALVLGGLHGRAAALVGDFAAGLRGRGAPAPAAALECCRAVLLEGSGDFAAAARAWETASAAWDALPRPYDALLARERAGRCLLRAAGASPDVSRGMTEVADALRELGAHHDARRVRRTPGVRRAGRRGYGDQLSPREREVVELVLTGLTNKQIAETLSRSPKTVAAQLNSAMRKRGATSRTALAVTFAQEEMGPA